MSLFYKLFPFVWLVCGAVTTLGMLVVYRPRYFFDEYMLLAFSGMGQSLIPAVALTAVVVLHQRDIRRWVKPERIRKWMVKEKDWTELPQPKGLTDWRITIIAILSGLGTGQLYGVVVGGLLLSGGPTPWRGASLFGPAMFVYWTLELCLMVYVGFVVWRHLHRQRVETRSRRVEVGGATL